MINAKIIGLIASVFSIKILIEAFYGEPANGVVVLSNWLSGSDGMAISFSVILGIIGLGFGLRALIWNKVCIGDTCEINNKPSA